MSHSCLGRIRSYYSGLSEKEKNIADYILKDPNAIVHCTIDEAADRIGVAYSTVSRFCSRIGYKGYQAMKIALAAEMASPVMEIHEEIADGDDERTVAEKVFRSNIRTLENTIRLLDLESFGKAVEMLASADRIDFYGTGGSSVIAMDAYHKFMRTGKKAFAFMDAHFQLMTASQLTNRDVAVMISHSGKNQDTIRILSAAQESGASTIGITGFAKSPISQKADVTLYTSSEETEYRSEALASRIAQLSLIDALSVNVMIRNLEQAKTSLDKVRHSIRGTRI